MDDDIGVVGALDVAIPDEEIDANEENRQKPKNEAVDGGVVRELKGRIPEEISLRFLAEEYQVEKV